MKALKAREEMLAYILDKKGNMEQEPVRIEHFITLNKITALAFFQAKMTFLLFSPLSYMDSSSVWLLL